MFNKLIIFLILLVPILNGQDNVDGRISISSFSNYSEGFSERSALRLKQRFSLDVRNIADSKFSFTSYINSDYRQYLRNDENLTSRHLNIYALALCYDINNKSSLIIGRKINPVLSNIGAIDGLQYNRNWEKYSGGIILGSRPDFNDYGYNNKLLEAGIYGSRSSIDKSNQISLALTQQMNGKSIDRRSLYFSHQNKVSDKFRYYLNGEFDLYKKIDSVVSSSFRLTGLYISTTYRPNKALSFSSSYNSRKNIIYYETFKSYAEQLFNDETRHGIRTRINWKISRYIYFGLNSGYRFKKGDDRSSYNYSGSISHSKLPLLNVMSRLTVSYLRSNYLEGEIVDFYISKNLFSGFLAVSSNYKNIDYNYTQSNSNHKQQLLSGDLTWQLKSKLSFTLSYYGSIEDEMDYNQIYFVVTQRF